VEPAWAASPLGQRVVDFLGTLNASFVVASRSLDPAAPDMLFTSTATSVRKLDDPANFVAYFGQEAMDAFNAIRKMQARGDVSLAMHNFRLSTRQNIG
jgi:hypothetical protein